MKQKLPHEIEMYLEQGFQPHLGSLQQYVETEVLTRVVIRSSIFWYITPSNPLQVNGCFGGICRLNLQGRRKRHEEVSVKHVASRE
jgi:hypothetical protein